MRSQSHHRGDGELRRPANVAGFVLSLAVMYVTALLTAA
jgi:hypothetical protein